jgi:hypothetical protein
MVAPVGRRPVQQQQQPKTETPPKTETTPPPQQPGVSTEGQELVQLLQKLGQQLSTAWTAATKEPGGDPVVKFLRAFTGGDANTATVQQENQAKMAERQSKSKDAMGFSVSEPEAPKKPEATKEAPKVAEGHVAPDASFSQTKARIAHAKADFQATKAEAGELLYSLSKELKLAKEAGQTKEQISATVMQLLGEFRNGTALAPDLVAIGDQVGAQIAAIGLMGDSPAAYEALALQLLDGKAPAAPPAPPEVEKQLTVAEALAAFEARGGQSGGEVSLPVGDIGISGQASFPRPTKKRESGGEQTTKPVTTDTTRPVAEQRRRDQQRLDQRRREDERRRDRPDGDSGGGGGASTRIVEEQLKTTQLNDQLNRTNLDRDLQNRRIEEDQLNRRRN